MNYTVDHLAHYMKMAEIGRVVSTFHKSILNKALENPEVTAETQKTCDLQRELLPRVVNAFINQQPQLINHQDKDQGIIWNNCERTTTFVNLFYEKLPNKDKRIFENTYMNLRKDGVVDLQELFDINDGVAQLGSRKFKIAILEGFNISPENLESIKTGFINRSNKTLEEVLEETQRNTQRGFRQLGMDQDFINGQKINDEILSFAMKGSREFYAEQYFDIWPVELGYVQRT